MRSLSGRLTSTYVLPIAGRTALVLLLIPAALVVQSVFAGSWPALRTDPHDISSTAAASESARAICDRAERIADRPATDEPDDPDAVADREPRAAGRAYAAGRRSGARESAGSGVVASGARRGARPEPAQVAESPADVASPEPGERPELEGPPDTGSPDAPDADEPEHADEGPNDHDHSKWPGPRPGPEEPNAN